ncbi:MAG: Flp pilus assembly protein CpaB [Propionibacteriales bacterium]|nr:Flp pilus assembly protein CpaB [Propionibacteriales bacterium]
MQRRLIAAIAAVILAGIGAVLLFNYVATADSRAMAGQDPVDVLVVTQAVKPGALASELVGSVEKRQIPRVAVVPGAITSLDQVAGKATTTSLQVGEQVIESRFAEPGTSADGDVQVPDDMQVVTIALEQQRTIGGTLSAGNKVAVYLTYDNKIQQILQNVTVVNTTEGMVTLALKPSDVQRVVLGLQSGQVWLAKEAKTQSGTTPLDAKQLIG